LLASPRTARTNTLFSYKPAGAFITLLLTGASACAMFRTENGASSSSRYHEQRTLTLLPLCGSG